MPHRVPHDTAARVKTRHFLLHPANRGSDALVTGRIWHEREPWGLRSPAAAGLSPPRAEARTLPLQRARGEARWPQSAAGPDV